MPARWRMLKNLLIELKGLDISVINDEKTQGKHNFWRRWREARKICLTSKHDDFLIIPDDVVNLDLAEIKIIFEKQKNKAFFCNLINDGRKLPCWNSQYNESLNFKTKDYNYCCNGYFDCGGLTNRATLKQISIAPINSDWFDSPTKSSGVGYQLTEKAKNKEIPMYTPSPTLASHGGHESEMHKQERRKNPLIANRPLKKICAIATMPGREIYLAETLKSLQPQFDEIHVYDNGKEDVDLTDNGKFFFLKKYTQPIYYFTCDDDIIYPPTYAKDMINEIERTKSIVTIHGRKLGGKSNTYYFNPLNICYHCAGDCPKREILDVCGTGVTAFRTDYFNPVDLYKSQDKRMADLVFSLEVVNQGKKIVLMPHSKEYIKVQNVPEENTIFGQQTRTKDKRQAEIQNQIIMARLKKTPQAEKKQAPVYQNKMVEVLVIKSHPKMGYIPGQAVKVTEEEAKKLTELKMIK